MFSPSLLFLIVLAYLLVLFGLAYFAEAREKRGASLVSNPYVYSLSLAVYCTSWTFYGSVGKAATSGLSFITIYIGPTLMAVLWWVVLRKMVVIAKKNRITTISDFIGSRYGRSLSLSAIVTVIALVGITPYLGLQMKAIISTFEIISGGAGGTGGGAAAGWFIALMVGIFAVIFGARRLDASERHEGLVFVVAFESIIKLVAFVAAGAFVTFFLFDGFGDVFDRIAATRYSDLVGIGGPSTVSFTEWASLIFLSMMAVMFLPRQFHVAVVENSDTGHIMKAMWLFPLYLFAINVFVLPVALGGLLLGGEPSQADSFVLTIPLGQGSPALALLVFLGGFSAATGMIIVESLALSTMVMNSLVMPAIYRFNRHAGFPALVLNTKRLVIIGCVFLGYYFAVSVGEFYSLVDMGLKSFEAVTLFAPCVILGLYWKRGNKKGAAAGLLAGFAVWLYTLLIPALSRAGVIGMDGLPGALSGMGLLDPSALFGVKGLGKWSHSLFWSLLINLGLYAGVSIVTRQSAEEARQALIFVESYAPSPGAARGGLDSLDEIEGMLGRYIGPERAAGALSAYLASRGIGRDAVGPGDIPDLRDEAEKILSGALGPAIAALVMRENVLLTAELSDSIMNISNRLRLSREELEEANRQLSFLKEFSENIIESVPVGLATLDRDMNVTYWNREMTRITGIPSSKARGGPVSGLDVCVEPDIFAGRLSSGEFTCRCRRGGDSTIKVTVSPFEDPRGGYVILFEDITEKLRRDKELLLASKYASIGKMTAGISHEIGNPLASLSSLVQEVQTLESPEFTKQALGTVNEHVGRIARIVRSLGDFARINTPDMVRADLGELIESTLNLTRFDKKFKRVELTKDIAGIPPVMVNPDQIQQVFLNLILNAFDAMPDGGTLIISSRVASGFVEVSFKDSGEGMDKGTLDKVFDPFFTTKGPGRGTGLGLSICYGIIKEHGGTISVESEKGKGATFTVRLPVGKKDV